jgi:hypothetical protein
MLKLLGQGCDYKTHRTHTTHMTHKTHKLILLSR